MAHADIHKSSEASTRMGLKAPGMLTFLFSFIVVMAVIFARFFDAKIPGLNQYTEFIGLILAYGALALGCMVRGL